MIELLSSVPVGFAVLSHDLKFVCHNEMYARLTGVGDREIVGMHFEDVFPGAEIVYDVLHLSLETGKSVQGRAFPYTIDVGDGFERRYFDFVVHSMKCENENMLLIRLSTVPAPTVENDDDGIADILRRKSAKPIMTGQDAEGRHFDVFVHPAAGECSQHLTLVAIQRDTWNNVTLRLEQGAIATLALAQALHVQS